MKSHMKLWVFALLATIVSQNFQASSGLKVDKDGGYHVVLAIKNNEAKPANVDTYINNIKNSFRTLSTKMWIATRESFYISNLEIILPQSWGVTGESLTSISYSTADIRVSSANRLPHVENNNLCGLPGDFIELPKTLFDNGNTGTLGENWKVLLVSWARYRWGAYEEHGIPGDKKFPYFIRDFEAADGDNKWVPNGCTNAEDNKLVGAYRTLIGAPCDPTSTSELDLTCRFYPDKTANLDVTSSLMHFHFMDSVYEFCDASTHQKNVPTKQNLYCDNKSVMETIESSPDYKAIENKNTYVPILRTTVSVSASKPSLYILLDNGLTDSNDASVLNQVILLLGNFFNDIDTTGIHKELIVGLGEFPSEETGPYLKSLVPLGLLSENKNALVEAIGNRKVIDNANQDFGIALQQAAAVIKATSPVEGGSILFVKASGARNASDFSMEKELELALRRDNIKLFTLEVVDAGRTRQNLADLAAATKGDPIALSREDSAQIPSVVPTWLASKVLAEYSSPPSNGRVERIAYSGIVTPNNNYAIPVWSGTQMLTFMLATVSKIAPTQLFAGIDTPQIEIRAQFSEGTEFNKTRYVYTGILNAALYNLKEVTFRYPGNGPSQLTVLSDGVNLAADISVTVQTTAVNGAIDLGNIPNPDAPFVISAVVTQNNRPVIGAKVVATINLGGTFNESITLPDAPYGLSTPEGDGIYSEIYLAPRDGDYTISVTVSKPADSATASTALGASTLFIPPSQDFGVTAPVPFPSGATKSVSLESSIHVTNAANFVPTIQTVRDLVVTANVSNPAEVKFEFTATRVFELGSSGSGPTLYKFYETESRGLLIDLDVNALPGGVREIFAQPGASAPGTPIAVSYTRSKLDVPLYLAVVSFNSATPSRVSNIVMIAPLEDPDPNPTTQDPEDSTDPDDTTEDGEGTTNPGDSTDGSNKPTTTPSPPEPEPEEESKPWIKTTGGIVTVVVIVLVCFGAAGGGYWYMNKRRQSSGITTNSGAQSA